MSEATIKDVMGLINSINEKLSRFEYLASKYNAPQKPGVQNITAREVRVGFCFIYDRTRFTKVKFTGFLLNSTIVADVMSRGDIFVYNHSSNCVYCFPGNRVVEIPVGQ